MYFYRLFGGVLQSDVALPELRGVAAATPAWSLRTVSAPAPSAAGPPLGREPVTENADVRLEAAPDGYLLSFDDTGTFHVHACGRTITWHRPDDADMADAATDITSRVLALALHAAGIVCLHGSAVAWNDRAVAFLAPKLHGKSTLALATLETGARLLTDDTLPVDSAPPPRARPGLPLARLWADSATRLAPRETARTTGDKVLLASLPEERITRAPARLDAIYILSPSRADHGGSAAWRSRLQPREATLLLLGHTKIGALLGGPERVDLLDRAAALAHHTPVYRLGFVRDFDRLDAVARRIADWHAAASAGTPGHDGAPAHSGQPGRPARSGQPHATGRSGAA